MTDGSLKLPRILSDIIIKHMYGEDAYGDCYISEDGAVLDVFVKIAKPINYIKLNFVVTNSNVSFEEIVNAGTFQQANTSGS